MRPVFRRFFHRIVSRPRNQVLYWSNACRERRARPRQSRGDHFNREVNDIAYYYETRLADELEGVDDVMFHPIDPVSARATLRISF